MTHQRSEVRIGLLSRGDHAGGEQSDRARERLAPLYAAFADLPATVVPVVYDDEHVDEVREQVLGLDGVLVWVNPVQDGVDRAPLDVLLREVADAGIWVSAHPDLILRLGTKEVLYSTKTLGWGTDTDIFRTPAELAARLPDALARHRTLVLKQGRGMGGDGVWKVELDAAATYPVTAHTLVRVQHAASDEAPEQSTLAELVDRCAAYFAWSGLLVTQPYQERLADGMIRAYFVHDTLVGFQHQWPTALLREPRDETPPHRGMEDPDSPAYKGLRASLEDDWIPGLQSLLGLRRTELPVIWDADFLYGPRTAAGADTFVLCEVNVSCVWPYPPQGAAAIAQAALARVQERRAG